MAMPLEPAHLTPLAARFSGGADITSIVRNPSGHINDTFVVTQAQGTRFILQRINTQVFRHPVELTRNIALVTAHLREKLLAQGGDPARETLTALCDADGAQLVRDTEGGFWRAFLFIEGTVSVQRVTEAEQLYQAGRAFGRFQNLLSDFPAEQLFPSIPHFHDTGRRFAAFEQAVREDAAGRAEGVREDIAFALARGARAGMLQGMLDAGELPVRVTHNDTKINNVMLDAATGEAVCVIDLDTVMPGSLLFDFGDAIRSGTNTADEDEPDLSRVHMDLGYYRAFTQGFLEQTAPSMTALEKQLLPFAAQLLTYECGIRFLGDYLQGDVYFHVDHPRHNLDRARTQFRLVAEMEEQQAQMEAIQREVLGK